MNGSEAEGGIGAKAGAELHQASPGARVTHELMMDRLTGRQIRRPTHAALVQRTLLRSDAPCAGEEPFRFEVPKA